MTIDFRASQIQTKQIIASGSTGTGARLLIYGIESQDTNIPNEGQLNQDWDTSNIGTDILVFISGSVTASNGGTITATGGDLLVSGSLMSRLTKTFVPIGSYISSAATASNPQVTGQAWLERSEVPHRTVKLRTILSSTGTGVTASVQLWNVSSGSFVNIGGAGVTELTTTSQTPVVLTSVELTTATNYTLTGAIYEVRAYIATGSASVIHGSSMFVCGG